MDAANRWETEAMRESRDRLRGRPSVSQDRIPQTASGDWRTLREASDLAGIPVGTLRKWCRRDTVDSYLKSDGETTLRMVEMGSVRARAESLHGKDAKRAPSSELRAASTEEVSGRQTPVASQEEEAQAEAKAEEAADASVEPPATMIVPVDAWNKMLNQLGNLHEAGQQLAEARERAAKAETESLFLRERLAEMREAASSERRAESREEEQEDEVAAGYELPATSTEEEAPSSEPRATSTEEVAGRDGSAETVSFWRYVARGWKGRRR